MRGKAHSIFKARSPSEFSCYFFLLVFYGDHFILFFHINIISYELFSKANLGIELSRTFAFSNC